MHKPDESHRHNRCHDLHVVVPFLGASVIAAALLSRCGAFDCHVTVKLKINLILALDPGHLGHAASMAYSTGRYSRKAPFAKRGNQPGARAWTNLD